MFNRGTEAGGGVNVGHSLSPPSHFMLATGLILHTALTFTYLVLVGRKRTPTTVRKDPGGVANLSWAGWVMCKDTLKLEPCCVVSPAPSMVELIK